MSLQAVPEPRAAQRRKPFLILGLVAALVGGAIATYAVLTAGEENTDDAQVQSDLIASTDSQLFEQLEGREITLWSGQKTTLHLAGAEVTAVSEIANWRFAPGPITKQLMDDYSAEVQPKGKAAAA